MSRRIGNIEENFYLSNPIKHQSTKIATEGILENRTENEQKRIAEKTETLLADFRAVLGKPFFAAPGFILFNCDSLESMKSLQGQCGNFDLTITSPPYNIGKEYESSLTCEEYIQWCSEWMSAIHSLTSPTGSFWLNLGYFEVPGQGLCVPISYLLWNKSPFYLLQEIVWHYEAGVSTSKRLCPRNEKWLFFVKDSNEYTFNLDEIRDPNVKYPNQKKNGKFRCNPLGKNPSDVWLLPKVTTGSKRSSKERTSHPAQFPLAVVERIVLACSHKEQIILDPFAGSCSTGIAAHGLGRIFVGFEIQKKYCELSMERFKNYEEKKDVLKSQPLLF